MRNMKYLTSKVAQGRFLWGRRYSCYLVASLFRLFVGGENHQGLASTFTISQRWNGVTADDICCIYFTQTVHTWSPDNTIFSQAILCHIIYPKKDRNYVPRETDSCFFWLFDRYCW